MMAHRSFNYEAFTLGIIVGLGIATILLAIAVHHG